MNTVFMMIQNPKGYNTVVQAKDYIAEKVQEYRTTEYRTTHEKDEINYTVTKDTILIQFSIKKYDSAAGGLKGNYDDFYVYTNNATNEENIIVSPNEDKIKGFCAYINRLTFW